MMFNSRIWLCALASIAIASPAQAWTLVNWSGSPTGQVWGAPWTSDINTIANSPLRWTAADSHVWYEVFFEGRTDAYTAGATLPGLAASLIFTLESVTNGGKSWTFDYALTNASNNQNGNLVTASRVSTFSFDVNPDEKSANLLPGGFFTTLARDVSMNAGSTVGVQDICVKSGQGNNCNGGGGTGILLGQTGTGAFQLNYLTAPSELVFTDPMVRYQSLNFNRPGGGSVTGSSGTGVPVAWVPEPATWALMIMGFGGIGAVLRRTRRSVLA